MPTNFYMYFVAALIPMIIGFIYYHPKVAGTAWMKANNFTPESLQGGNMGLIFGVSYVLSLMLAFTVGGMVIHQTAVYAMMMPEVMEVGSEANKEFAALMEKYGNNHRSFTHGVIHGVAGGLFFVLPVLGTNALFEKKGWRYILVNVTYWVITLALMGGLLAATLNYEL